MLALGVATFWPVVGSNGAIVPVTPNLGKLTDALWMTRIFWLLGAAGS